MSKTKMVFGRSVPSLDNRPDLGAVRIHGKPMTPQMRRLLLSADLEMTVDQASELTLAFDDPGFELLASGVFDPDTVLRYQGLHLYIAVLETNEGAGLGGIRVQARPLAIKRLKNLRGKKVYKDVSPAGYIIRECREAGVGNDPVAQRTAKKKRVVRDRAEKGTTYEPGDYPSAWTTMRRLAGETGSVLYEVGGTIFFGRPTWLVEHQPVLDVNWYPEDGTEPASIPEIRRSVDSKDVEITVNLPLDRASRVFPGMGVRFNDFPVYDDTYYITRVSYPLTGEGDLVVDAATVRNPEPQTGSTSSSSSFHGEWVEDADKRGINCKYTPREMVERAYTYIGQHLYNGLCQKFVDVLAKGGDGGGASNGADEWSFMPSGTQHGTDYDAPAGAVLCWSNPHTAIAVGNGKMITTGDGGIRKMGITEYMSMATWLGWKYPNLK